MSDHGDRRRKLSDADIALVRVGYDNDIRVRFVAGFLDVSARTVWKYYRRFHGGPLKRGVTGRSVKRAVPKRAVPNTLEPVSRLMAGR